ncbi:HSP20 family protein [Thermosporothrix hazakensis]|uniref:HSP20 family protein n=1 Tax=Thermosporothrix hazakensis TaxID=644383 RepID=A0A326U3T5_THEHA|nr:Hsp20/alpha crystallin family protein [Thermosporothrix hazakensis]PZW26140.1 HSP20 family protein [Thermosporothrix hazakensis]GCE51401.1 heat-shock protein [Thermosporothrix hazakensis]
MTMLKRYDPFNELFTLRDAMNRLFDQSFVHPAGLFTEAVNQIPVNVLETEQGYEVQALLPGVKAEDIELTVKENTLTLKGKYAPVVEEGKQVNWLLQEFGSGEFTRSITFEKALDSEHIETSYENGMLKVYAPINEAARPKRISIKAQQPKELAASTPR